MDLSEKYQRMCKMAEPDMPPWTPTKGDWFWWNNRAHCIGRGIVEYDYDTEFRDQIAVENCPYRESGSEEYIEGLNFEYAEGYDSYEDVGIVNCVRLYTQDQLQTMVADIIDMSEDKWRNLNFLLDLRYTNEWIESFEQLWLAFVMHNKYSKVWDDNKSAWVIMGGSDV